MSDTGTVAIKGIPPPAGLVSKTKTIPYIPGLPVRQEINKLASPATQEEKNRWTLFVLALEKFKALPVNDKLSYFQVSGIHDYPQVSWDQGPPQAKKGDYCKHNDLNFPTWHRPYMLLFEQLLWKNMNEIIAAWALPASEATRWQNAANTTRLPYWDWSRKQLYMENFALPQVLTQDTVEIFPPAGANIANPSKYPNPLYEFRNPEKINGKSRAFGNMPEDKKLWNVQDNPMDPNDPGTDDDPRLPWSLTSATGRWGVNQSEAQKNLKVQEYTGLEGVNNFAAANANLGDMGKGDHWYKYNPGTLSDATNRLLNGDYVGSWLNFSSTRWASGHKLPPTSSGWMSLEYVHNNIHNNTGGIEFGVGKGVGHMGDPSVAAFDPVFWLHHCQVDRLLSFWQALYWDLWWDESSSGNGAGPDEPLRPFHKLGNGNPDGDFLTSTDVRDWTKFGYQYDDLVPTPNAIEPDGTLNEARYKTDLKKYIQKTYPSSADVVSIIRVLDNIPIPQGLSQGSGQPFKDYIVNVDYDRYALGGKAYSIKFYLGGKFNVSETLYTKENYVGEVYTFSKPYGSANGASAGCKNCKAQAEEGVLSQGQVLLTIPLLTHIYDTRSDHPIQAYDQVLDYLKLHLGWKFIQQGGVQRPPTDFPRTVVRVLEGTAKPQYLDRDFIPEAEKKAVARLPVNRFAERPDNNFAPISASADPRAATLPAKFADYTCVHEVTADQGNRLQPPVPS